MNYYDLLILRYLKPLESLADGWLVKAVVTLMVSLWAIMTDMFATEGELVLLLFVAIFFDLVTGIVASRRTKVPVTSLGLRQTVVKVLEYLIILTLISGISNTFEGAVPGIEHLVTYGYLFAIITEGKSVVENISKGRESRIKELWEYIIRKLIKK